MFYGEDKRTTTSAPMWRVIKEISEPAGNSLHAKVVTPGCDSKCECARVCIWGTKCVIKQRSEYVINRYVINPTGGGKNVKKKEARIRCCLGMIGDDILMCNRLNRTLIFLDLFICVFFSILCGNPQSPLFRRCCKCHSG